MLCLASLWSYVIKSLNPEEIAQIRELIQPEKSYAVLTNSADQTNHHMERTLMVLPEVGGHY